MLLAILLMKKSEPNQKALRGLSPQSLRGRHAALNRLDDGVPRVVLVPLLFLVVLVLPYRKGRAV